MILVCDKSIIIVIAQVLLSLHQFFLLEVLPLLSRIVSTISVSSCLLIVAN